MSKGGGQNTTTQQTQTNPRALQAYQLAADTGASVAAQPYPTYGSPLVAGFNPTQTSAFNDINAASGLAQPWINQAGNLIQASTSGIDPFAAAAGNMSPYTQQVVDALRANQNITNRDQQSQLEGQAIGAGAYGGDRLAVTQNDLARKQALGNNPAIAAALEHGYDTALSTGLAQQQANAALNAQGAFALGNLGNEAQSAALSGAGAKLQAGNQQQTLAQNQLNVPYSQWQQAQAYPFTISNFLSGIASGAAGAGGSSSTTYPGPSALSQGVGLGTLGLGLYNSGAGSALGGFFGSNYEAGGLSKAAAPDVTDWFTPDGSSGWYNAAGARGGRVGLSGGGGIHPHMPHFDLGGTIPGLAGGGGLDWLADPAVEDVPDFHAPTATDAPFTEIAAAEAPYVDSRHVAPLPGLGPVSRRAAGVGRAAGLPLPPDYVPPPEDAQASPGLSGPARDTGEPLGLGARPSTMDSLTSGPGGALIAAGLGILGGSSPHAGVNIGQGGLQGLQFAQQERLRAQQAALKAQQAEWLHEYQTGRINNQEDRNRIYADRVAGIAALEQARAAHLGASAAHLGAANGHYTYQGVDENGLPIILDSRTGTLKTGDAPILPKPADQARIDNQKAESQRKALWNSLTADQRAITNAAHANALHVSAAKSIQSAAALQGKMIPYETALAQAMKGNAMLPGMGVPSNSRPAPPAIGSVQGGYRFNGGDPALQSSWSVAP